MKHDTVKVTISTRDLRFNGLWCRFAYEEKLRLPSSHPGSRDYSIAARLTWVNAATWSVRLLAISITKELAISITKENGHESYSISNIRSYALFWAVLC